MNRRPLVSIVIPVYNGANYLGAAIESALAQTYRPLEVLVVDDGSDDGGATRAVAASFGDRIRYLAKPNGGVATALNLGIREMQGELFSWLSHDDLYKPRKVERQVEAWRRFGRACIVIGDWDVINEQGEHQYSNAVRGRNLVARPLDAVFQLQINGCTLLVPRQLFDRVGTFEPGLPTTQDYQLWFRMARAVPFVHCPGAEVRQRVHPGQGSREASHLDEAARMFIDAIEATPPEVMRAYDGSELRFLLRLREPLGGYPALRAYLARRFDALFRRIRYHVAWTEPMPAAERAGAEARLRLLDPPPVGFLPGHAASPHMAEAALAARGEAAGPEEAVLFLSPARPPGQARLRAALEAFALADADAIRETGGPALRSRLDGLLARRDALPALERAFEASGLEGEGPFPNLCLAGYAAEGEPPPVLPGEAEVAAALQGGGEIAYQRLLSVPALARILAEAAGRPGGAAVLLLSRAAGDGPWTHLRRTAQALARHVGCILALGEPGGLIRLRAGIPAEAAGAGGLVFRMPEHAADLARLLRAAGVVRAEVQHVPGIEAVAEALLDALGLPFDLALLDYHMVATEPHLVRAAGRFAGDGPGGAEALRRPRPSSLLARAERVLAPSRDLAARVARLSPGTRPLLLQPWGEGKVRHVFRPPVLAGEPLRVALVGPLGARQGGAVVLEAARLVARRDLPIRFHHLGGEPPGPEAGLLGHVLIRHGAPPRDELQARLGGIAPHLGWVPAQVPEAWSQPLGDFVEACLPVAASAIGVLVERCHGRPATWLLPWDAPAADWVDLFLLLRATGLRAPERWGPAAAPATGTLDRQAYLRPVLAAASAAAPGALRSLEGRSS